jgi:hypothetical protein
MYTTHLPSGETFGSLLLPLDVSCFRSLPSGWARQISKVPLRFEQKIM